MTRRSSSPILLGLATFTFLLFTGCKSTPTTDQYLDSPNSLTRGICRMIQDEYGSGETHEVTDPDKKKKVKKVVDTCADIAEKDGDGIYIEALYEIAEKFGSDAFDLAIESEASLFMEDAR